MHIHFDFETRSLVDLKKVGVYKYAEHPSTDLICYAFAIDDGEPVVCLPGPLDSRVAEALASGATLHAWNAEFEITIWNTVCVPKYGWPPLLVEQCRDVMAQAAAQNLPQGLDDCAKALGLPAEMQKDKRGKYLIQTLCKPRSAGAHKGEFREDPALLDEMMRYNAQDVVAERAVAAMLSPLPRFEQVAWEMTLRVNQRGVPVAVGEIRRIIALVEMEKVRLNHKLHALTGIVSATRRDAVLEWLWARGLELPDITGDTVDAALARDDIDPDVRTVLEIRSKVASTSTAKFNKMLEIACNDGRVHGLLTYHGASTGRFASRGGLNLQNLPRPPVSDSNLAQAVSDMVNGDWLAASWFWGDMLMDAAVSTVRAVVKAPEGYELIDADFSSVENRVASWISGQDDKVQAFASGLDEHKVFAVSMYDTTYEEVTKHQRQVAKSAVLGGMFGQGWKGLIEYATGYGVTLDEEQSRYLIDTYRGQYPKVQAMWHACGDAIIQAVEKPGVWLPVGKVRFCCANDFLWLELPSKRRIAWYRPEIGMLETPWGQHRRGVTVMGVNQVTRKWERQKLIGSSAFQSAVQGTARDLLVFGMHNLEQSGYPLVLCVHDEALALVRKGEGDVDEFGEILCTRPSWAADLPLAYEGWRGERFRK